MTLDQMKKHFFNESDELGLASETDIQRLATWLEANDFDADYAWTLWESAREELAYLMADAMAEFA
jgi:hypothetical protein